MSDHAGINGWTEWKQHVLSELDRLSAATDAVAEKLDRLRRDDLNDLRVQLAVLQTRASIWGGVVGLLGGVLATLLTLATRAIR